MKSFPNDAELDDILAFAITLGARASEMIVEGSEARWGQSVEADAKLSSVDVHQISDTAVEAMIKKSIAERFSDHKFFGEETYAAEKKMTIGEGFTWIVDPIDGTMNFVHNNPYVASSIGVAWNGKPVVGVIALPFMNHLFSARLGTGAFLNGSVPLPLTGGIPQPLSSLSRCLIGAEWGTDRSAETFGAKARSFVRLAGDPAKGIEGGVMAQALRTTGSSACNIALVASGQLDLYWDAGCWAWDVCAGAVILQESGGYVSGGKEAFEGGASIEEILVSRRWVCVRGVAATKDESSREIQHRLIKELYQVVEPWTTVDM